LESPFKRFCAIPLPWRRHDQAKRIGQSAGAYRHFVESVKAPSDERFVIVGRLVMRINLGRMDRMSRSCRQLLSLFVALALLFSPLQGAFAQLSSAAPAMAQEMSMGHDMPAKPMQAMAGQSHDMSQMDAMADHECDQCKANSCCIGAQCLSGHCATCAAGLIPVAFSSPGAPAQPVGAAPASARLQRLSDSLFRPPRV